MSIRQGIYFIKTTLSANVPQNFKDLNAKLFHMYQATGTVNVKFDGQGISFPFAQGVGFEHNTDKIQNVELESTTTQEIMFAYGEGSINDFRTVFSGSVTALITIASVITPFADVSVAGTTTTLISAANTNKDTVLIHNDISNTDSFRIGDATANSGLGIKLMPGSTITLQTTAAIYAYNEKATAQTLSITTTDHA